MASHALHERRHPSGAPEGPIFWALADPQTAEGEARFVLATVRRGGAEPAFADCAVNLTRGDVCRRTGGREGARSGGLAFSDLDGRASPALAPRSCPPTDRALGVAPGGRTRPPDPNRTRSARGRSRGGTSGDLSSAWALYVMRASSRSSTPPRLSTWGHDLRARRRVARPDTSGRDRREIDA